MEYTDITFEEAKELIDAGAVLVDTREESEFAAQHAEGAELLPVDDIDADSAAYVIGSRDTPVITYCRSGARAKLAAQRLSQLGYKRVYNMGSIVGWEYGLVHGL